MVLVLALASVLVFATGLLARHVPLACRRAAAQGGVR
jgi:hypothetical protein